MWCLAYGRSLENKRDKWMCPCEEGSRFSHSLCESERNAQQVEDSSRTSSLLGTGGHTQKGPIANRFNRVPTEEWARMRGWPRDGDASKDRELWTPPLGRAKETIMITLLEPTESWSCGGGTAHQRTAATAWTMVEVGGRNGKTISQLISPPNRQPPASSSLWLDPVSQATRSQGDRIQRDSLTRDRAGLSRDSMEHGVGAGVEGGPGIKGSRKARPGGLGGAIRGF